MKILLATDDSLRADYLTEFIRISVCANGTEILVMSVVQQLYPAAPEMARGYAPELQRERKLAQKRTDRIAVQLAEAGYLARTEVRIGDARACILNVGAEWNADLIVMGSNGHGTIRHFLFGGVAEYVARRARCSLAIVRRPLTS